MKWGWMLRRAMRMAFLLVLGFAVGPSVPLATAQTAVPVEAVKDGWWNRLQGTPEEVPSDPTGLVPAIPRPPTVPEGSLPVTAAGGDPTAVAAIDIEIDAPLGSTVNRLTMTLTVAEDPGAEQNPGAAAIIACPITTFWGATENGEYANRPEADCEAASAPGTRNDDGTWTFDLTPIARLWLDQFATVAQDGVLLVEAAEPPTSFQVAFDGLPDGIAFEADIIPSADDDSGFDFGGGGDGFSPPAGGGSFGDSGSPPSFGGGTGGFTPSPPPAVPTPPTEQGEGAEDAGDGDGDVAAPVFDQPEEQGNILGNLPVLAVLLPVVAILLAVTAGSAVGTPLHAAPAAVTRREGGVSRALAHRARTRPTSRPVTET